jgi:hypothetical protein
VVACGWFRHGAVHGPRRGGTEATHGAGGKVATYFDDAGRSRDGKKGRNDFFCFVGRCHVAFRPATAARTTLWTIVPRGCTKKHRRSPDFDPRLERGHGQPARAPTRGPPTEAYAPRSGRRP